MSGAENTTASLSYSLGQVIAEPIHEHGVPILEQILEAGLDVEIDDDFLRGIPFISVAISAIKLYSGIERLFTIKKLASFIAQINNDITEDTREDYIYKFNIKSRKERDKELEYLLVIINRYISFEQPQYLAKLYLSFLQDYISFEDLVLYSTIIDSLLPDDIFFLLNDFPSKNSLILDRAGYINRLRTYGLIEQKSPERTALGQILCNIIKQ